MAYKVLMADGQYSTLYGFHKCTTHCPDSTSSYLTTVLLCSAINTLYAIAPHAAPAIHTPIQTQTMTAIIINTIPIHAAVDVSIACPEYTPCSGYTYCGST